MNTKFYDWLKSKYGSVSQAPGYTCGESFDAGYEAGQKDMRDRCAALSDELYLHALNGADIAAEIRALPVDGGDA